MEKPEKSKVVKKYCVRKGDTLLKIADRVYGDPNRWIDIYESNRDIVGDGYAIWPGAWMEIEDPITWVDDFGTTVEEDITPPVLEDFQTQEALLDLLKKIYEMLREHDCCLCKEQKEKFSELREEMAKLLLKKFEKDLDELKRGVSDVNGTSGGGIVTKKDKSAWYNEENVENLAMVIQSEMSVGNEAEQTAVGYVVLNRMKRNGKKRVSEVMLGFATGQTPTKKFKEFARKILKCNIADNSGGATHFYSPRSMPKEGENTANFDVEGGLEKTDGLDGLNYKPGWANDYERIRIKGVRDRYAKFYRQQGQGPVK